MVKTNGVILEIHQLFLRGGEGISGGPSHPGWAPSLLLTVIDGNEALVAERQRCSRRASRGATSASLWRSQGQRSLRLRPSTSCVQTALGRQDRVAEGWILRGSDLSCFVSLISFIYLFI